MVPEFEPAITVANPQGTPLGMIASKMSTLVEMDLGARPTRTRIGHGPKIFLIPPVQIPEPLDALEG
jgi:hypothetical protein